MNEIITALEAINDVNAEILQLADELGAIERVPVALLEGMAAGLPVVTTLEEQVTDESGPWGEAIRVPMERGRLWCYRHMAQWVRHAKRVKEHGSPYIPTMHI